MKRGGCYARVDFRMRPNGKPCILEVNPNPCFSPTAGLAGCMTSAGIEHAQFTVQLVHNALARGRKASPVLLGGQGTERNGAS